MHPRRYRGSSQVSEAVGLHRLIVLDPFLGIDVCYTFLAGAIAFLNIIYTFLNVLK